MTANVAAGIGGLDVSIGIEILYPENFDVVFNDILFFFKFFFNVKMSTTDLITLGTVISIGVYGGS